MAGYIGSKSSVTLVDGITEEGGTLTGDLSFGDNDKAKFGAGDDLQIYHDGSHSYVADAGGGSLILSTNGSTVSINTDGPENMAVFRKDSSVDLFHNNSKKFETTSTGATIRGDGDTILLLNTASDAGDKSLIRFGDNDDADAGYIDYDHGTNALAFGVNASERMRIDASGNVLVGQTSFDNITDGTGTGVALQGGGNGTVWATRTNDAQALFTRLGTNGDMVVLRKGSTGVGSISTNGSSTSYNTSSDYRLKENVVDLTGASARVNQLDVRRFNFIADDTNTLVDGFLAHEVATVVPEAVTGTHDGMMDEEYEVTPAVEATYDDDGNELTAAVEAVMGTRSVPDYQGIDQSKLVPLLTAALQEALTEIASLKTRVEALEA